MSVLAIKNTKLTLSSVGIVPCAMFGGTPANPVAPTLTSKAISATASTFVMDPTSTYAYGNFGAGLGRLTLSTGAITQILTPTQLGSSSSGQVCDIAMSDDATTLYILTDLYTLLTMPIASPSSVAVVVGTSGTSGTADGTGTAASISSNAPVFLNQQGAALGGTMYIYDSNKLRKIQISTWQVTTLGAGAVIYDAARSISNLVYYGLSGALSSMQLTFAGAALASTAISTVPGYSSGNWNWIADVRQPLERCVYGISSVDAKVWRYDLQTATWTNIATLPSTPSLGVPRRAFAWVGNTQLYVLSAGYINILS